MIKHFPKSLKTGFLILVYVLNSYNHNFVLPLVDQIGRSHTLAHKSSPKIPSMKYRTVTVHFLIMIEGHWICKFNIVKSFIFPLCKPQTFTHKNIAGKFVIVNTAMAHAIFMNRYYTSLYSVILNYHFYYANNTHVLKKTS